jgi:hypothetical protein
MAMIDVGEHGGGDRKSEEHKVEVLKIKSDNVTLA